MSGCCDKKEIFYSRKMGSVYLIVKTALGADTRRKCQMAEIKTGLYFAPTKRPKNPNILKKLNKMALIIIKGLLYLECLYYSQWNNLLLLLLAFCLERSRTKFFLGPFGNAANFWLKTATEVQFLLRNSHSQKMCLLKKVNKSLQLHKIKYKYL